MLYNFVLNRPGIAPLLIILLTFAGYVAIFATYHVQAGDGVASLALIPVIIASWYFGAPGGVLLAAISVLANTGIQIIWEHSPFLLMQPGNLMGTFSLFLVAIVTGRFAMVLRDRKDAIQKLEQYEKDQREHTRFLELLNESTARALEADSLQDTLRILIEKIAHLFQADDAFFAFWDAANQVPIPTVAYGSLTDVFPHMQFEPNEAMLSSFVVKSKQPIFVPDIEDSPYISPRIAALFPSRSMLGIPLIAQDHMLGVIVLGFNTAVILEQEDIIHAEVVAEQLALVLSKSQLLEDERRQVRQLTALHEVARVAVEAENEDQLIERVSHVIGHNLFPDNFGIMLLDERSGYLRPHPSYHFFMAEDLKVRDLRLGQGITDLVARSGQPRRIGDVRRVPEYSDVDDRTISELCVPIKFRERVLGVINAESTKRDAFSIDDERLLVTLAGQLAPAIEQFRKAKTERYILDQLAHDKDLIYSIAQITAQIERSLKADQIIQTMGQELEKIGLTCLMTVYDANLKSFTITYTSMSPRLMSIVERLQGHSLIQHSFPRHGLEKILKKDEMVRPGMIANLEEEMKTVFTHINVDYIPLIMKRIGVSNGVEPLRLPLVFEENLLGMLWIWGEGVTRSDLPILSIFAKQIGMTLERARLFEEVQSLAFTDSLTGLQNRRSLFELGKIEFSRATRLKRAFSCMMLDLDHFKSINDKYGHQVGDQVLQEFASRCKRSVRDIDLVGRYGGEELIVLLPETNRELSVHVAERLRASIAESSIRVGDAEIHLTVSIGVATQDENTPDLHALIARADQAMYIAKHKGRNQVAISI